MAAPQLTYITDRAPPKFPIKAFERAAVHIGAASCRDASSALRRWRNIASGELVQK
jgi:hypothetical protein